MTSISKLAVPLLVVATLLTPSAARAHCDAMDGPVITAARAALENGKLAPVLAWVRPADEAEIRAAFARTRAVRKGGKEARELADTWFFETLVRVHRAGEGAPYTGLKPAGSVDPAVAAADRAIVQGDAAQLEKMLVGAVREGLHGHVAALEKERAPADDVAAGRRWVAAYVPFVHWAEGVYAAAGAREDHSAHATAGARGAHAGHAAGGDHAGHAAASPAEPRSADAAPPKAPAAESGHHEHH